MARDANGRYVDDDDYYGVGDRAAYGPSPERLEPKATIPVRELDALRAKILFLHTENQRLRAVMLDAAKQEEMGYPCARMLRAAESEGPEQ